MPSARVLLVDADVDALAALAADLRGRGLTVAVANGVAMACERAKVGRYDVVVATVEMAAPKEGGLGLLDMLALELGKAPPHVLVGDESAAWEATDDSVVVRGDLDGLVTRVAEAAAPMLAARAPESVAPGSLASGSLANASLADLLEALAVDEKSGTLGVTTPAGAGDVRLVEGAVADAVYLRFEGIKALVRLTAETEGRFAFTPGTPPVMRRMRVPTAELLARVHAELDAARRLRAELGDLTRKALLGSEGNDPTELSPAARALLAKLRAPSTVDEILDEAPEADSAVLASIAELEAAGRLKKLPHDTNRVPLAGADHLPLVRALVSRASAPGFNGAARLVFAGTPMRLAVFGHAALCLTDAIAAAEPPPAVPIPYPLATVRLGDEVDLELVALPLVPVYAPLWPMALAGAAVVVRLDDAASAALTEACASADVPVNDAQRAVGALEEASVAQVAAIVRAALEGTSGPTPGARSAPPPAPPRSRGGEI